MSESEKGGKKKKPFLGETSNSLRKAMMGRDKSPKNSETSVIFAKDKCRVSAFLDADGNPREYAATVPHASHKKEIPDKNELIKNPRYRILKEMKDSERTYLTFLQSVVLLFHSPCKSSLNTSSPILPQNLIDDLFGNILDVAEISSQVLQAIEVLLHPQTWSDSTTVGDLFIDLLSGDLPRVYSRYVGGYGKRLKALANTPDQFNQFRRDQEASQLCGNHTLSSLLITPIQRIPRYILLLRDLLRSTSEDHKDYRLLPNAINELKKLAASLDETKKRADTRDQFSLLLNSLQRKCDSDLQKLVENEDIEAAGNIIEYKNGNFIPLFCFLFIDMMIACVVKKDSTVSKIAWKIDLNSTHLQCNTMELSKEDQKKYDITQNNYISLTELKTIDREPFSINRTFIIFPTKAPYDMGFWYNSILSVITNLWFDKKVLLRNSNRFKSHIEKHLFPPSLWKLLKLGSTECKYKKGEKIIEEGNIADSFYIIKSGAVKIKKPYKCLKDKQITLSRLRSSDFFGEFAFVTCSSNVSAASVIASTDTIVNKISFTTLTNLLESDPTMMYRFFRFICCVIANRLVLQLFTKINSDHVKQKRRDSKHLHEGLKKLTVTPTPSEDNDELIEIESDINNSVATTMQDLYIPELPNESSSSSSNQSQKTSLTKKYNSLLSKRVDESEQVLLELSIVFMRPSKSDQRAKLLLLENHICIIYKSGFTGNKLLIENLSQIIQVLENENQHMLVVILEGGEIPELRLLFDSHSDYSKINSLLQIMGKKNSRQREDYSKGIIFNEHEWAYILSMMESKIIPYGDFLAKKGTGGNDLYFIKNGEFIVQTNSEREDYFIGKDAIVGELTFLQGGATDSDVIANSEDCEVYCLKKSTIEELTCLNPLLVGKLYRLLASQMVHRFLTIQNTLIM